MKNKKVILIVLVIIVIIGLSIWYYNKTKKETTEISSTERYAVKCVPDCFETEICIKGACVKKKINSTSTGTLV